MTESITILDKVSAVEAVNKLGEEDLRYLNRLIVERLRLLHQARSTRQMAKFSAGDRVSFFDGGVNLISGIVARLNRKTLMVMADNGMRWNVAPGLLKLDGRGWGPAREM